MLLLHQESELAKQDASIETNIGVACMSGDQMLIPLRKASDRSITK